MAQKSSAAPLLEGNVQQERASLVLRLYLHSILTRSMLAKYRDDRTSGQKRKKSSGPRRITCPLARHSPFWLFLRAQPFVLTRCQALYKSLWEHLLPVIDPGFLRP